MMLFIDRASTIERLLNTFKKNRRGTDGLARNNRGPERNGFDPVRGRVILLTGAAGGLGTNIAAALAGRGARLVLTDLPGPKLNALEQELATRQAAVFAWPADLTSASDLDALFEAAGSRFGGVDVLINNAGVERMLEFHKYTPYELQWMVDVNLVAPMELSRRALAGMLERGFGRIVNISSLAAKAAPPYASLYAATKAALLAHTRSLRKEYRSRGVSASAVVPGFVRGTGMFHRVSTEAGKQSPRFLGTVSPEEVSKAVLNVLETDAAEVIVNPGPMRILAGIVEMFPDFGGWLGRQTGSEALLRGWAGVNETSRVSISTAEQPSISVSDHEQMHEDPETAHLPPKDRSDHVCVVGAGAAGLAAAKNLADCGFRADVLEKEADLGGVWNYESPAGRVYRSTRTISSKPTTEFPDFPLPDEDPEYLHHSRMLSYLRAYANHFGVDQRIEYHTPVERIEPAPHGGWMVTTGAGQNRKYRAVVIANGHNREPKIPSLPGEFHGHSFHSAEYRSPEIFAGKRVLVIGGGNSGCDIAVDATQAGARKVYQSLRRGYHILPKFFMGRPVDQINDMMHRLRLPLALRRIVGQLAIWLAHGSNRDAGLPRPDHRLFEAHPLVNQLLPYYVRHADILPKPDVAALDGNSVRFSDSSCEEVDILVYATGFRISFPFMDDSLLNWQESRPGLYLNVFHPRYDNLFVAGLIQPDSGEIFLLHWQTRAIALFLKALESGAPVAGWFQKRKMHDDEDLGSGIRYTDSPRHALEVEHWSYYQRIMKIVNRLEHELASGRHRRLKSIHNLFKMPAAPVYPAAAGRGASLPGKP